LLEGWPDAYLEIIAIDPDAPAPRRARWFGMDTFTAPSPRLVHVVARAATLEPPHAALAAAGFDTGRALAAQRDDFRWRITVRDDGGLLCGGALPTLIEWQGPHPASRLRASGVVLESLALRGLPAAAADALQMQRVILHPLPGAGVEARLRTPRGMVTLSS
jgi:hypothetical protein